MNLSAINTPPKAVSRAQYLEQGTLFPLPVLEKQEVKLFRDSYEAHVSELEEPIDPNRFKQIHLHFDWAYKLVTHPSVIAHITPILGPNVLVHGSSIFRKLPHDSKYISWHQDGHYMQLQSFDYVSAWIALSDSNKENGCMRVIKGTHHTARPHTEVPHENNLLGSGLTLAENVDESKAVEVELKAGEMSLHHVNLIHGSNPNQSNDSRIGVAVRYISAQFQQKLPHHEVVVAAGQYDESHFEVMESQPQGTIAESIVRQKKAHDEYYRRRLELQNKSLDKV